MIKMIYGVQLSGLLSDRDQIRRSLEEQFNVWETKDDTLESKGVKNTVAAFCGL